MVRDTDNFSFTADFGGRAEPFTILILWMPFTIVNAIHNFVNAIHKMSKKVVNFDEKNYFKKNFFLTKILIIQSLILSNTWRGAHACP